MDQIRSEQLAESVENLGRNPRLASSDGPAPQSAHRSVAILTVLYPQIYSFAAATSMKLQRFMREDALPHEQKTLRSVARCAGLCVFFGSTGDENTILLAFMKRGSREGTMRQHH